MTLKGIKRFKKMKPLWLLESSHCSNTSNHLSLGIKHQFTTNSVLSCICRNKCNKKTHQANAKSKIHEVKTVYFNLRPKSNNIYFINGQNKWLTG